MTFSLNPDQLIAATTLDRPVLVTAGAGSGKTRMLTQRLINAVMPGAVDGWDAATIDQIAAITFTEKAAGELAERVRRALREAGQREAARGVDSAWLSTIHGMCSRLLRRHALDAGIDPLFTIAEGVHVGQLREEAFEAAAIETISSGNEGASLFDAYSYGQLYEAAVDITRQLAVRGLTPDAIQCETSESLENLTFQAVELFSHGCTACEGYSGTSDKVVKFTETCEQLLAEVLDLNGTHHDETERLFALARLVDQYSPLGRLKDLHEQSAESRELHEELKRGVATALSAPHGPALRRLIERYADRYSKLKAAAAVLDFDDLQVKTVELLERDPALARRYRAQFRLVMIDEFQDTDALQLRLVEALSDRDVCTVGDEKQSIYRFRGADIDVYRDHQQRMKAAGALSVQLPVNYRSHPNVLAFVNAVFSAEEYFGSQNLLRLESPDGPRTPRPIDGPLGDGPRVEALFVDTSAFGNKGTSPGRRAEAAVLAKRFSELADRGVPYEDMAILLRAYSNAHVYAEALASVGIPAVIVGGSRFFELTEIGVMRALVRAIANPSDGVALGQLFVSEFCPISDDGLALMRISDAGRDRRPLWEVLREASDVLPPHDRIAAARLAEAIERATSEVGTRPLGDVVLQVVEHVGYDLRLLGNGNVGRDGFANVLKFARQASAFESRHGGGPAAFADSLDARQLLGEIEQPTTVADTGQGTVRIMSVHASKGLEFPVVAVVDLAGRTPGSSAFVRTAVDSDKMRLALSIPELEGLKKPLKSVWMTEMAEREELAEWDERNRLLYVACTRAEDLLIIGGSANLRPKKTTSKSHLIRLAGILGLDIPLSGTQDVESSATDSSTGETARCRVRVIDASAYVSDTDPPMVERSSAASGPELPPAGERFPEPSPAGLAPQRTSYSSLALFKRCPRRYFAETILGLRRIEVVRPGQTTAMQFGSAMHAVLQLVDSAGSLPADERIDAIARHAELDPAQVDRLRHAVSLFASSPLAQRVTASERVCREMPFAIPIAGSACLLRGTVDLYARDGGSALIVDYKSGSSGSIQELAERYRLQARCYALAALTDGAATVQVVFVRPEVEPELGKLEQVEYTFGSADEIDIRSELDVLYSCIENSEFPPLPAREQTICDGCPAPAGLCPNVS